MKRLGVVLLSGLLLFALSCLGANEITSEPVEFTTTTDTPTVIGAVLNPAYFANAAYVLQGVEDRDKVFALPLRGVPELAFLPTSAGLDPASVTWSLQVSHPEGIGAEIADNTLYIWGNGASWSGYGTVTLSGATADAQTGSVTIPVTVFRSDKTLVNSQGKKDYFVPWSPQLDINRILSVEEHMRKYNKDDGLLDRMIRFSRWRLMEYRKDVDVMTLWFNELIPYAGGWDEQAQFALVDVFLGEFLRNGVNGVRMGNAYYFPGLTGTEIAPRYDVAWFGVTKRPEEIAYVVNEAHRLGMSVLLGNTYYPHVAERGYELFDANPTPLNAFYANVEKQNHTSLLEWTALGMDMVEIGSGLESPHAYPDTSQEATFINDALAGMADGARQAYPGPIAHYGNPFGTLFPGKIMLDAPLWEHFDVIGAGLGALRLTPYASPTLEQLVQGWKRTIRDVFSPFQQRYDKPFLALDNGCFAVAGCANWGSYCHLIPEARFSSSATSLREMQLYYLSQDAAFKEMEGYFGPGWHYYSLTPYDVGSVRDRSINPRMKVEDVIQLLFLGGTTPRKITIDGSLSDWQDVPITASDPAGDSHGANDLVALRFAEDDEYYFFRVDYTAPPAGFLSIDLDAGGDARRDAFLLLNNVYTADGTWWGDSFVHRSDGRKIGFVDSIDSGASIELRVAKRFLQGILSASSLRVHLVHCDKQWKVEDETGWFRVSG